MKIWKREIIEQDGREGWKGWDDDLSGASSLNKEKVLHFPDSGQLVVGYIVYLS